jgi:pseudouridine kinase
MTQAMDSTPVLVIGATSRDLKGRITGTIVPGVSNPGAVRRSVGGVARNVAENLARLGVNVSLMTAVGDDSTGREILRQATETGVDTSQTLVVEGGRTGAYLAVLDSNGSLAVAVDDMAVLEAITPRYLHGRRRMIAEAAMVVVDANLTPAALETLFGIAARANVRVCADPTSPLLATRLRPYVTQLAVVTPNAAEAEALTGLSVEDDDDAQRVARYLVSLGVGLAVVTLGERGLAYATSEESGRFPAIRTEVVDLTGAGDALTAGVIFGLLNDLEPVEAVRLGLSAATLTLKCAETVCPDLSLEKLYDQLVV